MSSPNHSEKVILIIDDSEELLEVLSIVLKKQGYEVITRTNTEELSCFVLENKIDLLLLDVILADENGKDVCKKLKSNPLTNYFPIFFMSVTFDNVLDFKEWGADGFIEKPFQLSELIQKINTCMIPDKEPVN